MISQLAEGGYQSRAGGWQGHPMHSRQAEHERADLTLCCWMVCPATRLGGTDVSLCCAAAPVVADSWRRSGTWTMWNRDFLSLQRAWDPLSSEAGRLAKHVGPYAHRRRVPLSSSRGVGWAGSALDTNERAARILLRLLRLRLRSFRRRATEEAAEQEALHRTRHHPGADPRACEPSLVQGAD